MRFMATSTENTPTSVRGVIKDITEQHQKERQIEVFDRVLRHNLRNDLNLIRGTAETVASKTTGEIADHNTQIMSKSDRLLETVSVQRDIMEILRDDPAYEEFDIAAILEQVAASMREQYPQAELTVESPARLSVEASSHFTRAVEEVVQNAIEHNDVRQTSVQLVAEQTDDAIHVQIADNGPPIPEMERDVLVEPRERTPLYHGSGLGLWFVKLIIFRSNGEIWFDENDPHGNIITIEIPE
ncbi:MAG: histidine kinase-, DNA gyrase B-, and HSP90-like ATPase [Halonotius sp. J07HN6]|nr:MAG: histidine kinase-, DNA gyrase B-, and HSP90-like ATPase [Halonotius sp. J07HN6]